MNPNPTTSLVFAPSQDVVSRNIAGEHILVPIRSGVASIDYLYTADEVGSFIFAMVDGRRDVSDIARAVSATFEVDETRALQDVTSFLDDMRHAGLVTLSKETA